MESQDGKGFLFPSVKPVCSLGQTSDYDTSTNSAAHSERHSAQNSKSCVKPDWLQLGSYKPIKTTDESIQNDNNSSQFINSSVKCSSNEILTYKFEDNIRNPSVDVDIDVSSDEEESKSLKKKPRKDKKKHKKHKSKQKSRHDISTKRKEAKQNSNSFDKLFENSELLIKEERKGDVNNLMYGSLYKLDVVQFTKRPFFFVGLAPSKQRQWMPPKKIRGKSSALEKRYFSRSQQSVDLDVTKDEEHGSVTKSCSDIHVKQEPQDGGSERWVDFLPLNHLDKAPSTHLVTTNDAKISKVAVKSRSVQQSQDLHKRVLDEPENVNLWVEFIQLQDESITTDDAMSKQFSSGHLMTSKMTKQNLIERKLSIIEKALKLNPRAEELLLLQMELLPEIDDFESLSRKWKAILFQFQNSSLLWKEFLRYHLSAFTQFSVGAAVTQFTKYFKSAASLLDGTLCSHQKRSDTLDEAIGIFMQYVLFSINSGYSERAIASLQALIEFNTFAPSELKNETTSTCKSFFEPFWDSSAARFGDDGAKGWSKWYGSVNKSKTEGRKIKSVGISSIVMETYQEKQTKSEEELCSTLCRPEAWHGVEMARSSNHWIPANRDVFLEQDTEQVDDPDRVVLYDDISGFLFKVEKEEDQFLLILLLLSSLGCLIPEDLFSTCIKETFTNYGIVHFLSIGRFTDYHYLKVNMAYNNILSRWRCYFVDSENFKFLTLPRISCIRRLLDQSLLLFEKQYLSLLSTLWLHFEVYLFEVIQEGNALFLMETKKSVKAILALGKELLRMSTNRDNVLLWTLYGEFEWFYGSRIESQKKFDAAITLFRSNLQNKPKREEEFLRFCRRYSELLLGISSQGSWEANSLKPLLVLSQSINPASDLLSSPKEEFSPTDVLRTRKQFTDRLLRLRNGVKSSSDDYTSLWTEVMMNFILFEYVTSGVNSLSNVLSGDITKDIDEKSGLVLLKYRLCLITHHVDKDKSTFALFRTILREAVMKSSDDYSLMYLFIQNFQSGFNSFEIRKHFYHLCEKSTDIQPWIGAVMYEMERFLKTKHLITNGQEDDSMMDTCDIQSVQTFLPATGIINRIRASFTRAVDSKYGKQCVALWRAFMEFEISHGNQKEGKSIFYQALQNCPWSKALYMDAVKHFPQDFQEIIDIMQEKEIRLCFPVEELDILIE